MGSAIGFYGTDRDSVYEEANDWYTAYFTHSLSHAGCRVESAHLNFRFTRKLETA